MHILNRSFFLIYFLLDTSLRRSLYKNIQHDPGNERPSRGHVCGADPKFKPETGSSPMVSAPTPAQIAGTEGLQSAVNIGLQRLPYTSESCGIKNLYSHLVHGIQRSHAHAAGKKNPDTFVRQSLNRNNTATLFMTFIVFNAHILNETIPDACHGIGIAMAEMCTGHGVKSGRRIGRNGNKNGFGHSANSFF